MVAPPGYCPVHGVVPIPGMEFVGAGRVTFEESWGMCPRCPGREIPILDGEYEFAQGFLRILSAPEWTRDALAGAEQAARRAKKELEDGKSLNHALNTLADSNKALADAVLAQAQTHGWNKQTVLALISTLIAMLSVMLQGATTARDLSDDNPASEQREREAQVEPYDEPWHQGPEQPGSKEP